MLKYVCKAVGTLVLLGWPLAPFWPILHLSVRQFADFVSEVKELPISEWLILPCLSVRSKSVQW